MIRWCAVVVACGCGGGAAVPVGDVVTDDVVEVWLPEDSGEEVTDGEDAAEVVGEDVGDGYDDGAVEVAPPECADDTDCDDGRWCDGDEVCRYGECRSTDPPCPRDDGDPCLVPRCREADRRCLWDLLDRDGDTHLDALSCCRYRTTERADDCDDDDPFRAGVSSGYPDCLVETNCTDGIDNDCDTAIDRVPGNTDTDCD